MSFPESKFEILLRGHYQFSELIKAILPGEPSRYTITILISVFLQSEGASRVVELQAKILSKMGYSVVVYTFESDIRPTDYRVEIIDSWVRTYSSRLNVLYRAAFPFNFCKSLRIGFNLKKANLIIVHQETLVNVAYFAKSFYNVKLIYWHHHLTDPRFFPLRVKIYKSIISPFNWRKIAKFDLVVSISEHSKDILRNEEGIDSIVVYDEIDRDRFNRNNLNGVPIRRKYNIESQDRVILFIGRITPTKNIHSLISAFEIVKMRVPSTKLIIVGRSCNNQYAEGLMKDCDPSVIFAGFVPDEELPNYYAACDVYATCSLVEGFNMPLVEAQACGKPVVAFDIGPHKEVVRNGFLVDQENVDKFGAALIQILNGQK